MAKLVVSQFLSLDGVVQSPGGEPGYAHSGWVMRFPSPDQFKYKLDEVLTHDALLIGRKTYEGFAGAWPTRAGEFAEKMNRMPKYVASTTLKSVEWHNSTLLAGNIAEAVKALKASIPGKILVAGSRTLVNTLKHYDLIDEYRLMVFPVVLGSGMRLFDDTDETTTLRLISSQALPNGAVILTYHPPRERGG